MCNDRCPECNLEIEPDHSIEIPEGDDPVFLVETREVWVCKIAVRAKTALEASNKIEDEGYEVGVQQGDSEYSHVLDSDCWWVHDVDNDTQHRVGDLQEKENEE